MKSTMTMDQFLGEVARRDEAKKDFMVGPRKMFMGLGDDSISIEKQGDFGIKDTAHAHIAEKLGIPKKFYDDLPGRVPGLRAHTVNQLLSVDRTKRLVRTLDGDVRGVLSDRFKPIDNFMVLQSALPVLKEHSGMEVLASQLSDSRMYLQMTFPKLTGEITVGDAVTAGITITNSEIGAGAFDVRSFIMRLRCRNGMVGESVLRQYHVGRKAGENIEDYDIFADDTIKADMESFKLRFRDILKHSLTQATFESQLIGLRATAGQIILPKDIEGAVENVTRKYAFTQGEGKQILANLWAEKDISRWGLANAVTALVHNSDSADRQYDIERAGYDLMTLPQAGWNAIADVA